MSKSWVRQDTSKRKNKQRKNALQLKKEKRKLTKQDIEGLMHPNIENLSSPEGENIDRNY